VNPDPYLLSVAISFPVLTSWGADGARLVFRQTLALILPGADLNSVLLASCAPIIVFIVTGSDYHFIKPSTSPCSPSADAGNGRPRHGLQAMCEKSTLSTPCDPSAGLDAGLRICRYQMAWSLAVRGAPGLGYELFRSDREGNFYRAVWSSAVKLA
jgi:hypothetical protein